MCPLDRGQLKHSTRAYAQVLLTGVVRRQAGSGCSTTVIGYIVLVGGGVELVVLVRGYWQTDSNTDRQSRGKADFGLDELDGGGDGTWS